MTDGKVGAHRGILVVISSPSGAGKTTLAHIAARLVEPDRGRVRGDGRAGYVSQNPGHHLLRETVHDEVAHALSRLPMAAAERDRHVRAELDRFGIGHLAELHPRDLSGGERQRLAIASVTVRRPDVLLLDEPTRGMDGLRKLALAELLRSLSREGTAVGLITHDVDFAAEACDLVTTLGRGRVLADRAPRESLGDGLFFVSQAGLATGRSRIAEAAELIRAQREAVSRV
jgi:energy-coupling factor transport system ATP-binding protein